MSDFEREYSRLNDEQRHAVDELDGPLLVIAGPGTGKTQLLSMRVANILKRTDTDAAAILCLTFTNKAAANMRDRLLQLAGAEARDVYVKTFHSFAAEIINLYPEYFWNGARLSTVPDAVQLEIITDILAALPLDNPLALKFAGNFTSLRDVQSALKLTKEAGLTPEKLRVLIDANLSYIDLIETDLRQILSKPLSFKRLPEIQRAIEALPDQHIDELVTPLLSLSTVIKDSLTDAILQDGDSGKTTYCGKWKRRWLQIVAGEKGMFDERRRNAWWHAVADVYEQYRQAMHARGYYDYADMLVEVISKLEQEAELRASVQERFLYVQIDEFQDTNAAQLRLAHLVADTPISNGRPNLMAVGDDDQSIFKFNGAELNNMLSFTKSYPESQLVVLEKNYRSSQAVLDTAKGIIELAVDRLVKREPSISKQLVAENPPHQAGRIELISYPSRQHQFSQVAQLIKTAHQEDGTIAVLARNHESLRTLAAMLLALDVPVQYEHRSNILDHEAIRQACLIAETAQAIREGEEATVNHHLSQLLHHPMWNIPPRTLWQLAIQNVREPRWLDSLLDHKDKRLSTIGHWLLWISGEATHQPLTVMMEYILGLRPGEHITSPLRAYFAENQPVSHDYLQTLSGLNVLQNLTREFSLGTTATLEDFVRFTSLNRETGKTIADETVFVSDGHAVQLLTVHKAKGLEFDTVFVLDAVEDIWKPRAGGRKPPANLPLQPYGDDYDDYVRLMYVAATRARHTLIITCFSTDSAGREVLPSPLVRTALTTRIVPPEEAGDVIEVLEQAARWPRLDTANEKALLKGRLQNFTLTSTSLLHFLDLTRGGPQYFLERNILRLPEAKTNRMAFGIAMHHALEMAQHQTNHGNFDHSFVLSEYEAALRHEHLPLQDFERFLAHGQKVLERLFAYDGFTLPKGSRAELELHDIILGQARLSGTLDRVDTPAKTELLIVDYKTGTPLSSLITRDQTKAVKAWRHRAQLIFYALLAQQSPLLNTAHTIAGEMLYVEAETARDLARRYEPTTEDIARLSQLIQIIWQKIQNLDLPNTASYSTDIAGITAFEDDLLQNG